MAKKKTDNVAHREAYRYSGNPDDMPEANNDSHMAQVPPIPSFTPSRREDAREPDGLPQGYSPAAPSAAPSTTVAERAYAEQHLPSANHDTDVMPQRYSPFPSSEAVYPGVYDAGPNRAANHKPDRQSPLPNKDVPAPATNIFTSGGVRGAFEPVPGNSANVNWNEVGKQPVGWTPIGRPVYEQNGYDENKRPPLKTATEQMRAPLTSTQVYTPEGVDLTGMEGVGRQLNGKSELRQRNIPEFQKDPKKKDGGFFNWLGRVFKGRPGQREGETDDEYDERITRNNMRMATFANALRHMANLYYTSKGGLPQQFNDPNAAFREDLAMRKAEREKKRATEAANLKTAAEQAYKDAQLQLQRDKADADKYYKNMSLYYKGRDADREDKKFDWEKDKDKWNRNRLSLNDAWKQKFEERKQKATEGYQRGRLAVEGRKATAAMLRATGGGGGGSIGSTTNLATPKGHLNRKKELSTIEENQIFNFLKKNGNITSDYIQGWGSMTPEEKKAKIQFAIGYAASTPGSKGDKVREYLKKHHGYTETATSAVGGLDFN